MPPIDEYIQKMEKLQDSRWLTNQGKYYREFEKELKKYLSISNISLFTNGHMALELTIQSMNLTGEV